MVVEIDFTLHYIAAFAIVMTPTIYAEGKHSK